VFSEIQTVRKANIYLRYPLSLNFSNLPWYVERFPFRCQWRFTCLV